MTLRVGASASEAGLQLIDRVGGGGVGEVWRARLGAHGDEVAVKLLRAVAEDGASARAAFRREARLLAALHHPHVVRVLDHGEADARVAGTVGAGVQPGSPYLVMELAVGGALDVHRGQLDWATLRDLLASLLDGLAHAHALGLVHRDLKPGNLLLQQVPGGWSVRLTDFGLAFSTEELGDDEELEGEDPFDGTAAYMAPEQHRGLLRDLGPRTDLYAVGRLAVDLLVGSPFAVPEDIEAGGRVPAGFASFVRALTAPRTRDRVESAAAALRLLDALGDPPEPFWRPMAALAGRSLVVRRVAVPTASTGSWPTWRAPAFAHARPVPGAGLGLTAWREPPLVGRDLERDQLWRALARAAEGPQVELVVLDGPAGTGRSRLAAWVARRAAELGLARGVRASWSPGGGHVGGGPAGGLALLVARQLGCIGMPRRDALRRARRLLQSMGEQDPYAWSALVALFAPPEGGPLEPEAAPVDLQRLDDRLAVVEEHLLRLAADRPLVVWLDDVAFGVEGVLLGKRLLAARAPILLVLTSSDEALAERPREAQLLDQLLLDAGPRGTRTHLGPLEALAQRELVAAMLDLDEVLADRIERRTSGNPRFALQLVDDWAARGLLEIGPRGFRLGVGASVELPADLRTVWEGRLARFERGLREPEVMALELAAVLGQDLDQIEWGRAAAALGIELAPGLLDQLVQERLAVENGVAVGRWSFVNGMLRETILLRAEEAGRSPDLHRACARALEAEGSPARVAHHWRSAGEDERALGPLNRAVEGALAAGDRVLVDDLFADWEAALARLGDRVSARDHIRRDLQRARVARLAGDFELAEELAQQSQGRMEGEGGDPGAEGEALAARATRERALFQWVKGTLDGCLALMQSAGELARIAGAKRLQATCQTELGEMLGQRGRLVEAAQALHEAVALFEELGDANGGANSWVGLAICARNLGDLEGCAARLERAREGYAQTGSRWGLAEVDNNLGDLLRQRGQLTEAEAAYRAALAGYRRIGAGNIVYCELNLGQVLDRAGQSSEARGLLEAGLVNAEAQGRGLLAGCAAVFLLPVSAALGDVEAFDKHLERAIASVGAQGFVDRDLAEAAALAAARWRAAGDLARAATARAFADEQQRRLGGAPPQPD